MDLRTSGQVRLLETGATASAAAVTAGVYTLATLATLLGVSQAVVEKMFVTLGRADGPRYRGVELTPFTTAGASNETFSIRVWQRKWRRASESREAQALSFELVLVGTLACTVGTMAGVAGGAVSASEKHADTLVWTEATASTDPKGVGDKLRTIYGGGVAPEAYSPAGDLIGRFFLPDLGGGDLFLEPYTGGSADDANCLVEKVT
jgi:hypothetical protein